MQNYNHIDRSGFRAGQYTGYACNQVWLIRRNEPHAQWHAYCRDQPYLAPFSSDTLKGINAKLELLDFNYRAAEIAQSNQPRGTP